MRKISTFVPTENFQNFEKKVKKSDGLLFKDIVSCLNTEGVKK